MSKTKSEIKIEKTFMNYCLYFPNKYKNPEKPQNMFSIVHQNIKIKLTSSYMHSLHFVSIIAADSKTTLF